MAACSFDGVPSQIQQFSLKHIIAKTILREVIFKDRTTEALSAPQRKMKFTPLFTAMLVAGIVPFGQAICPDGQIAIGLGNYPTVSSTLRLARYDITPQIAISLGVRDFC